MHMRAVVTQINAQATGNIEDTHCTHLWNKRNLLVLQCFFKWCSRTSWGQFSKHFLTPNRWKLVSGMISCSLTWVARQISSYSACFALLPTSNPRTFHTFVLFTTNFRGVKTNETSHRVAMSSLYENLRQLITVPWGTGSAMGIIDLEVS